MLVFALIAILCQGNITKSEVDSVFNSLAESPKEAMEKVKSLNLSNYDFGLFLIETGLGDAEKWFTAMEKSDPTNQARYIFGLSRLKLYSKDPFGAKKLAVLSKDQAETSGDKRHTANCFYLLGEINLQLGEHKLAIFNFEEARDRYRELRLFGGSADAIYNLAVCMFLTDETLKMEKILLEYEIENKKRKHIEMGYAQLFYGKALVEMKKNNFSKAIQLFSDGKAKSYSSEIKFKALVNINIALCHALDCDIRTAMKMARDNETSFSKNNKLAYLNNYNDLVWLFVYKNQGYWDSALENRVLAWAKDNDGAGDLRALLKIIKKRDCPKN